MGLMRQRCTWALQRSSEVSTAFCYAAEDETVFWRGLAAFLLEMRGSFSKPALGS
jgi:hypothetical protein